MEIDLSHAPCEIHSVPLSYCGCPFIFADPDWLEEDARKAGERIGRMWAKHVNRAYSQAVDELIGHSDDTVLEDG
jgi:hypothetical protein